MWDKGRQQRVDQLREADARGALTETERAELAVLIEERCRSEADALEAATRQADERSASLEAQIEQTTAQNHDLLALIREQEAYLNSTAHHWLRIALREGGRRNVSRSWKRRVASRRSCVDAWQPWRRRSLKRSGA